MVPNSFYEASPTLIEMLDEDSQFCNLRGIAELWDVHKGNVACVVCCWLDFCGCSGIQEEDFYPTILPAIIVSPFHSSSLRLFFLLVILGFEVRASHLLGRHSTASTALSALIFKL
jgi:hypothetical protein